jgi:hypothetical protein
VEQQVPVGQAALPLEGPHKATSVEGVDGAGRGVCSDFRIVVVIVVNWGSSLVEVGVWDSAGGLSSLH